MDLHIPVIESEGVLKVVTVTWDIWRDCWSYGWYHWFGGLGNADKGVCGVSGLSGSGGLRDIDGSGVAGEGETWEMCVPNRDPTQKKCKQKKQGTQQKWQFS